jgi:hypothetical protein
LATLQQSTPDSSVADIWIKKVYTDSGGEVWPAKYVLSGEKLREYHVISNGDYGAIIVWGKWNAGPGSSIYARIIDSNGVEGSDLTICSGENNRISLNICSSVNGVSGDGAIVVWREYK